MFTGLNKSELARRLTKTNAPASHIDRIVLDLDPAS
jgi:hypothetical protein